MTILRPFRVHVLQASAFVEGPGTGGFETFYSGGFSNALTVGTNGVRTWRGHVRLAVELRGDALAQSVPRRSDGLTELDFTGSVQARSEVEAVYKTALVALEHELLEHVHGFNGELWCDPHGGPTPFQDYWNRR